MRGKLLSGGIIMLLAGFLFLTAALLGREFLRHEDGGPISSGLALMDREQYAALAAQSEGDQDAGCLYLYAEDQQELLELETLSPVLEQMKVSFRTEAVDAFHTEELEGLETVILSVSDLSAFGDSLFDLMEWTKNGGHLFFFEVPEKNGYFDTIAQDLGILGMGEDNTVVRGLHFTQPFMLGGSQEDYVITDAYDSSASILVDAESEVYLESTGERPTPLIWRRQLGEGTVVVSNFGLLDKAYRGFYAAAYSLLGDGFAWPVINGGAFYLDDFPAPVPSGQDSRINQDYGLHMLDFLARVWWPDMQELSETYPIRYSSMLLETYSNQVNGPFAMDLDVDRSRHFGGDILDMGGELGLHGYNHMPLVLSDFSYGEGRNDRLPWASESAMAEGMQELLRFCHAAFPNEPFQVYAPPSNILSGQGRQLLGQAFPQIRAIASGYLSEELGYAQEFEVAPDGIVETPRITSGYVVSDFYRLCAMSELNFHYVSTHSVYPNDVLDNAIGSELGWAEMYRQLGEYLDWVYSAAPDIRSLTASELAGAVQRYDALTVRRTRESDNDQERLVLELGNFADEAWLMVRLNHHVPGEVTGGTLEELLDGLYLLKAESGRVEIILD